MCYTQTGSLLQGDLAVLHRLAVCYKGDLAVLLRLAVGYRVT